MKKYELTDITKEYDGNILYRIRALRDFSNVHTGDLGGWIEKQKNLSHEGDCWIYNDAKVFGGAKIYDSANVFDNAKVCGDAIISDNARVYDSAIVSDNAVVSMDVSLFDNAKVCGDAIISDNARVYDSAIVSDNAVVSMDARVSGDAKVCGDAIVFEYMHISKSAYINDSFGIISVVNIGSRRGTTTFYLTESKDIMVCCGCFNGTIEEFNDAVHKTHKDNPKYLNQYLKSIDFAKSMLIETE